MGWGDGLSIEAMAVVLNHSTAKGTAKLVLLGIANHEGDGGAYPTIETLARYASVDERNVQRAIERLVSSGQLVVELQEGGDRDCPDGKRPNRYRLRVACPPWCDHTTQHRDTRKLAGRQLALLAGRVAVAPPHPPQTGGGSATPTGGGSATQTTQPTQPPTLGTEPQTARVHRDDQRPCRECGKDGERCSAAQLRWPVADRHRYEPLAVRHAKG